jgi:AI-2 transport protein TqsA
MKVLKLAAVLVIIRLGCEFMVTEKSYATPFVLAMIFCFFVIEIAEAFKRVRLWNLQMGHGLSLTLAVGIIGLLFGVITWIINANVHAIIAVIPEYQKRLLGMVEALRTVDIFKNIPLDFDQLAAGFDLKELFKVLLESTKVLAENIIMVLIYSIFILIEYLVDYRSILEEILEGITKMFNVSETGKMLEEINSKIRTYVVVKSSLNLLAALLALAVMMAFGLDFAPLWALLIFLLHFVPIVGGIVSFALPLTVALVQFGWHQEFFIILVSLALVMLVVGHVLEPKMMGHSLNLRPVVIIGALVLSNQVWGMVGMLLCIPTMVILKIILEEFPETKPIVNLISAKREAGKE